MPALSAYHVQGHQKGIAITRRQDPIPVVGDAISPELPSLHLRIALFLIARCRHGLNFYFVAFRQKVCKGEYRFSAWSCTQSGSGQSCDSLEVPWLELDARCRAASDDAEMLLRPRDEFTRIGNLVVAGGQLVKSMFQR